MTPPPQDHTIATPADAPRRPPTIEELMGRLADGDDDAIGPLFDAVAPVVRRYLVGRLPPDRVDVALQAIMLELHRGRSTYLPGADVLTWAFSFAQFIIKDAGASTSTLDDDVLDLVRAGLHTKQVAAILDMPATKVRSSVEQHRQRFESLLVAEHAKDANAPRLRPATPSAGDLIGAVIGRYRIDELIGSGGFGNVYRATRVDVGGEVAIKVMREIPTDDRRAVERFKCEARLLVEIGEHPNIVPVHADGELPDGRAWYAMALLRGEALDVHLQRSEPLEWPRVARLVRQLCSALAVVHRHDLVHGDVKPANCFLTDGGLPSEALRLLDFGLAKRAAGTDADRTTTPAIEMDGTAQYVAPEVLHRRAPDRRADVYAIGVMMFEMLTGEAPFRAHGFALFLEKTEAPAPGLAQRAGTRAFPRGIEAVVRRAMHRDPAQRFSSVEALSAAIVALGPDGRRTAPLWSLGRDARVRLAATASISALAASLGTAAIVTDSEAGSTPHVESLTSAHIGVVMAKAQPTLDVCREKHGDVGPDTATLRVLGKTGEVINVEALADSPASACLRAALFELRFPRFDAGEEIIEAGL